MKKVKDDSGSIYLFGIGLGIVALMVLTSAVNVAALWATRTKLDSIADGAALVATKAINLQDLYENDLVEVIKLNPTLARSKVDSYLLEISKQGQVADLRLTALEIQGSSAQVTLTAKSELPFGYLMVGLDSTVTSKAKAELKTR